jgi:transcriptional regulator with XRE-family HTH domain
LKIIYVFLDFLKISGDNGNMEESISKRIAALRNKLGLSKAKFAERIGVTGQFVSMVESGKSKFTEANIRLICFTFKVNEEWLREGRGNMIDDEAQLSDQEHQLMAFFRELSPLARKMLIEYAQKLVSDEKALREEFSQNAPGSATRPPEAPQKAKRRESTDDGKGANPIHNKKRG